MTRTSVAIVILLAAAACGTAKPLTSHQSASPPAPSSTVAESLAPPSPSATTPPSSTPPSTTPVVPPSPSSVPAPVPSNLRPPGTATSPFGALHLLARKRAVLVHSPEPPISLPPRPSGAYAMSPTVLVVGAADGLWRSVDAGRTWQRTLALTGDLGLDTGGPAGTGVVAATSVFGTGRTSLHVSDDGVHWRHVTPLMVGGGPADLFTDQVTLDGTGPDATGFAYPAISEEPDMGRGLLRTRDGGRHWVAIEGTQDVTDVARVPGTSVLFAAAASVASGATPPNCNGHVIRSDDNGLHWLTVTSSCTEQNLFSVDFVDATHGFAAGGSPNHYGGSELLLATEDGGRTWQQRFSTGEPGGGGDQYPDGFAQVRFRTLDNGLAVSGACVGGGDGPCGGSLWHTSDGGRSWHNTGVLGVELSGAGNTAVLTGSYQTEAGLAISRDGGATWSRTVAPTDLAIGQLSRTQAGLTAVTNNGVDLSPDDGRSWRTVPLAAKRSQVFDLAIAGSHGLITSHGFHLSWQPSATATSVAAQGISRNSSIEVGQVALASDDINGLAAASRDLCRSDVFATADGGRSWWARGSLGITVDGPIGYDGQLAAAIGECTSPPDIDYFNTIALSHDGGHSWSLTKLSQGYDLIAASVVGDSVWVMGADTKGNRAVLVSHDGGGSWTAYELVGITVANDSAGTVVALSAHEAVLTDGGSTLWRTTDGGATWRQERPALPAN